MIATSDRKARCFDLRSVQHIGGVDHPESLSVGPAGEVYTTGTGRQVYRVDVTAGVATVFAFTEHRCLGQAVDARGNLYPACTRGPAAVLRITPSGEVSAYCSRPPTGSAFQCPNYPAFDSRGRMYLSDSGSWSENAVDGALYRIPPACDHDEVRQAELWYPHAIDTPNGIALDAEERFLYLVETFSQRVVRIEIRADGSAGHLEQVVHLPDAIPDGIALDTEGRIWIACHRPDAIYVFCQRSGALELFCHDWKGERLRGPTDVCFAGRGRNILMAASLDNLVIHHFGDVGAVGVKLNFPELSS